MAIVVADNHYIEQRILNQATVLQAFPNLVPINNRLIEAKEACPVCPGAQASARIELRDRWNELRAFLATLPESSKQEMRSLLGLQPQQKLRVAYSVGSGASTRIASGEI